MEHPAAREPQQVVLAHGLRSGDAVAVQALGDALAPEPGLGRLHPDQGPARQGVLEAAGGRVLRLDGTPLRYAKPGFENPEFIARGA